MDMGIYLSATLGRAGESQTSLLMQPTIYVKIQMNVAILHWLLDVSP